MKTKMTPYLATAIAEGFCEGEGASEEEQIALDRAELHAIETAAWVKSHQAFEKSEAVKKAKESQITLF